MNQIIKLAAAAAVLLPTTANAATLVERQDQTSSGQNFSFVFSDVPTPLGDGLLSFLVRGDFTVGSSLDESFSFDAEGIFSQSGIQATNANLVNSFGNSDNLFEVSYALTLAELSSLAADGVINIGVDFANGVGFNTTTLSADPFVETTLTFPSVQGAIPEPATWAMMVLGFFGLGMMMRRRNSQIRTRISYS